MGAIVKNAPNSLIWAVTLCFLGVLAAFVYLSATGSDATDLRTFLNTILNIVSSLFSAGALVVAGAAAKSAGKAEEQTNGQLDRRIAQSVQHGIAAHMIAAAKKRDH